jgi:hypothetical protein
MSADSGVLELVEAAEQVATQDLPGLAEYLEPMVRLGLAEAQVILGHPVALEHLGIQDRLAHQARMELRGLVGTVVHQVPPAQVGTVDQADQVEHQVQMDQVEPLVTQVLQGPAEHPGLMVHLDRQEPAALMAQQEPVVPAG